MIWKRRSKRTTIAFRCCLRWWSAARSSARSGAASMRVSSGGVLATATCDSYARWRDAPATETNMPSKFTRRIVLQGLGATVALPWLESTRLLAGEEDAKDDAPPKRFAFLFFG